MTIREALERLTRDERLTAPECEELMGQILRGEATAAQLGALLMALRIGGESEDEIVGFARALRSHATPIAGIEGPLIDTCGTGGDGSRTQNISTASALVTAACGLRVAKHGNRSVSSLCGSADVLEALGVRIEIAPQEVPAWLDRFRFVFLYAPLYHPAMRHAAPVRRELGVRTVMNLIGPLANPAGVTHQVLGVYDRASLQKVSKALAALGVASALVVHGDDNLDEISVSGPTHAVRLHDGILQDLEIVPADAGLPPHPTDSLRGGDAAENAEATKTMLAGEPGAFRDCTLMNAGAALWIGGAARDIREGAAMARDAIDSGRATRLLAELLGASLSTAISR